MGDAVPISPSKFRIEKRHRPIDAERMAVIVRGIVRERPQREIDVGVCGAPRLGDGEDGVEQPAVLLARQRCDSMLLRKQS